MDTTSGIYITNTHGNYFAIYPNPTTDFVHFESEFEFLTVYIYNAQGQFVMEKRTDGNSQMDVSVLKEGIYLFKCVGEGFQETKKIAIRK